MWQDTQDVRVFGVAGLRQVAWEYLFIKKPAEAGLVVSVTRYK
jgi:hypothetical protein